MIVPILFLLTTESPSRLSQIVAWVFPTLGLLLGFFAIRLVKGYDSDIKMLKDKVQRLEIENAEIKTKAKERLDFYVQEFKDKEDLLTEIKQLVLKNNRDAKRRSKSISRKEKGDRQSD